MLEPLLAADAGYAGPRARCAAGHQAEFVSYRDKTVDTVLGPVTLPRAWYHCAACKRGFAPRDARLGICGTTMSPGLARMTSRAAAALPFAAAAGLTGELAGITMTGERARRRAEADGTAAAAVIEAQAASGKVVPLPPHGPAPDMLYIAVDGTGVPMTPAETAGRAGKAKDGTATTREVKLCCCFTQTTTDEKGRPVRDPHSSSYLVTFAPAAQFGMLMAAEARRRGAGHVRQLVFLGDGAAWIWNLATRHFPEATAIVDLSAPRGALLYPPRSGEGMEVIAVPGPDGLPGSERKWGQQHARKPPGRAQAYGTGRWGARVIWRKLDCLNPSLQKAKNDARRKDV